PAREDAARPRTHGRDRPARVGGPEPRLPEAGAAGRHRVRRQALRPVIGARDRRQGAAGDQDRLCRRRVVRADLLPQLLRDRAPRVGDRDQPGPRGRRRPGSGRPRLRRVHQPHHREDCPRRGRRPVPRRHARRRWADRPREEPAGGVPLKPDVRADVVVVGGGTAGAIVAARVAERGDRSVVLLEAGPDFPSPDQTPPVVLFGDYSEGRVTTRDFAWAWETVPPTPDAAPYTLYSGKVIGGGSSINGQVWLRGPPDDFDGNWAARGANGWRWHEVEPWYAAVERDLDFPERGRAGPVPVRRVPSTQWHPVHVGFLDACLGAGFTHCPDLNAPGVRGVGP